MPSIAQYVSKYTEFLNKLLSAGPDISDNLDDLKVVRDALMRIAVRTSDRFGAEEQAALDWQAIRSDSTVQSLEQQVGQKFAANPEKFGADKGVLSEVLTQIFSFLMANPALLELILKLFKKPA